MTTWLSESILISNLNNTPKVTKSISKSSVTFYINHLGRFISWTYLIRASSSATFDCDSRYWSCKSLIEYSLRCFRESYVCNVSSICLLVAINFRFSLSNFSASSRWSSDSFLRMAICSFFESISHCFCRIYITIVWAQFYWLHFQLNHNFHQITPTLKYIEPYLFIYTSGN